MNVYVLHELPVFMKYLLRQNVYIYHNTKCIWMGSVREGCMDYVFLHGNFKISLKDVVKKYWGLNCSSLA